MDKNVTDYGQAEANTHVDIHRLDEVQDMIGLVPGWLVRTGISLICMVLIVLLIISWVVKYPDVLKAEVLITTDPAPVTIVARSSGPMLLLVQEKQAVRKGNILAVIRSAEDWKTVLQLEKELVADSIITGEYTSLGVLQAPYNRYVLALSQWRLFLETDHHRKKITQMKKQLTIHKKLKVNLFQQLKITRAQQAISRIRFSADSLLYVQNVMSKMDFQQSRDEFLRDRKAMEQAGAALIHQELRIEELISALTSLEAEGTSERNRLYRTLTNEKRELVARIGDWKTSYLFMAPDDGRINYMDILHDNKYVQRDEPVFSLIPDHGEVLAMATLPVMGSGKVEVGQRLHIKLDHYPYAQYGMLEGVIADFPMIPVDGYYQLRLALPNGLNTTYGKELSIRQSLTGKTEIITEELRLIEKMFHWVRFIKHLT